MKHKPLISLDKLIGEIFTLNLLKMRENSVWFGVESKSKGLS